MSDLSMYIESCVFAEDLAMSLADLPKRSRTLDDEPAVTTAEERNSGSMSARGGSSSGEGSANSGSVCAVEEPEVESYCTSESMSDLSNFIEENCCFVQKVDMAPISLADLPRRSRTSPDVKVGEALDSSSGRRSMSAHTQSSWKSSNESTSPRRGEFEETRDYCFERIRYVKPIEKTTILPIETVDASPVVVEEPKVVVPEIKPVVVVEEPETVSSVPAPCSQSHYIYIDRIPPTLSDAAIARAINRKLAPVYTDKVKHLEVIRTQTSRHVHAFALLTQPCGVTGAVEIMTETGDHIKVQMASKELKFVGKQTPCRTLHLRLYGKRSSWGSSVNKMTWCGLLSLLEMISPGSTNDVAMIADDRSAKSNVSHNSVMLCVFFVQCRTLDAAIRLRAAVHDAVQILDNQPVLIRADFCISEKTLHNTSVNPQLLLSNFTSAHRYAQNLACTPPEREQCKQCQMTCSHSKRLHSFFDMKTPTKPKRKPRPSKSRKESSASSSPSGHSSCHQPYSNLV